MTLCPNGRGGVGQNRACYVPRPSLDDPLALKLFQFTGVMLGVALRTKGAFEVTLPPIVWKALMGHEYGACVGVGVCVCCWCCVVFLCVCVGIIVVRGGRTREETLITRPPPRWVSLLSASFGQAAPGRPGGH